ncbi:MAG TPA: hypothetical protein VF731_08950 [Solirubrobacterales bacterium]
MRLKIVVVAVGIAVVLIAAGCGSSGGGSTSATGSTAASSEEGATGASGATGTSGATGGSSSGPSSKKVFVKEAEAICEKIPVTYGEKAKALEAEAKKKGKKPTTGETNLKAAVPANEAAIEELQALSPPAGDEQKVEAIIASLEKATKGVEAKPESPLTGPKSPYAEWQKLTKAYGLKVCSQL